MGGSHLSSFPIFIAAVGLFFMNMLSWAVYVSDYSRYLPKDVSAPRVFWAVFSGNALATCLYGGLGIYITAISPAASSVASIGAIAGKWILPILALSLLGSDALNAYTGMLAIESVRSTWQQVVASRTARVVGLLLVFTIATVLALTGYKTFLTSFENFINVLLFFFVPWSVINLIDFYIVKKGRYDVKSFFTPKGIVRRLAVGGDHPLRDRAGRAGPVPRPDLVHRADGQGAGRGRHLLDRRLCRGRDRLPHRLPGGQRERPGRAGRHGGRGHLVSTAVRG